MKKKLRDSFLPCWLGWLFCSFWLISAEEAEPLKLSDIHRIMEQILSQHVGETQVSEKILQNALVHYLDQFDPNHIYLLHGERASYTHLNEEEAKNLKEKYLAGDFSYFARLNQLISNAILRSRNMRAQIEKEEQNTLFQGEISNISKEEWAADLQELKQRLIATMARWIRAKTFPSQTSSAKKIESLEMSWREAEDEALFQRENGSPLPQVDKDTLLTTRILKALAASLDAHTSFYKQGEAYDIRLRLQKQFEGIGIAIKEKPEGFVISRILEGSPAEKNGMIQPGDVLIQVERQSTEGLTFSRLMEILHDPKLGVVSLSLKRPASGKVAEHLYTVSLQRQEITLQEGRVSVESRPFGDGILGHITLDSFYQGESVSAEQDVRKALQELQKKGPIRGLIVDIRNNSGGFLSQAVKVAGLFITNGVIVISKYADGREKVYRDVDSHRLYDGPLLILTSKITASAAEILALALQDYGVALVVGDDHTYGKGTIQMQTVTDPGSSTYFKVTSGTYYGVGGTSPQLTGVKADIVVPGPWSQEEVGEVFAAEVIPSGPKIPSEFQDTLKDLPFAQKGWHLKYYTPSLQHPTDQWKKLLPTLRKNSAYRIEHNKNYQLFLTGKLPKEPGQLQDEEETENVKRNFGVKDLQLEEAFAILKDMAVLQTAAYTHPS